MFAYFAQLRKPLIAIAEYAPGHYRSFWPYATTHPGTIALLAIGVLICGLAIVGKRLAMKALWSEVVMLPFERWYRRMTAASPVGFAAAYVRKG